MSKQKIIVYVDGSYGREGNGGWSYLYYYVKSIRHYRVAYGNCSAKNSSDMELLACIKFFENVLKNKDVSCVEVRTDYLPAVDFFENKWSQNLNNGLRGGIAVNAIKQSEMFWYKLYCIVSILDFQVIFKKVERTNNKMKLVDSYARRAMLEYNGFHQISRIKTANSNEFVDFVDQDDNAYPEIPSAWSESLLNTNWFEGQTITLLPLKYITLVENVHLNSSILSIRGELNHVSINFPIAVRLLSEGKYGLVAGFTRFCIGKISDLDMIPVVITEMNHKEFIEKYGLYR